MYRSIIIICSTILDGSWSALRVDPFVPILCYGCLLLILIFTCRLLPDPWIYIIVFLWASRTCFMETSFPGSDRTRDMTDYIPGEAHNGFLLNCVEYYKASCHNVQRRQYCLLVGKNIKHFNIFSSFSICKTISYFMWKISCHLSSLIKFYFNWFISKRENLFSLTEIWIWLLLLGREDTLSDIIHIIQWNLYITHFRRLSGECVIFR